MAMAWTVLAGYGHCGLAAGVDPLVRDPPCDAA